MNEREAETVLQTLRQLLPAELMQSLPDTALDRSSVWTDEEIAKAIRAEIIAHVKVGWTWNPPYLEREISWTEPDERDTRRTLVRRAKVQSLPSGARFLPRKTPADRDFNPRTDALVLRTGARFIDSGPWAGNYERGPLLMRHDGSLLDSELCPGCQGAPWMVQIRSVHDRSPQPKQAFTYCRQCVGKAEVDELKKRQDMFGNQVPAKKGRKG